MTDGFKPLNIAQINTANQRVKEKTFRNISATQIRHTQISFTKIGMAQIRITQVRVAQIRVSQKRVTQIRPTEVSMAQIGLSKRRIAQIDNGSWMFSTPQVPFIYTLSEQSDMSLICHRSSLSPKYFYDRLL